MSLAPTNMRGSFLNWRFAVNGIQKARRSFGVALRRLDMLFSMAVSEAVPGIAKRRNFYCPVKLSAHPRASSRGPMSLHSGGKRTHHEK
jgi:hypothetical protein